MPRLTKASDGYKDMEFCSIIDSINTAESQKSSRGTCISEWMDSIFTGGDLAVLATFAGAAHNEILIGQNPRVKRLVLSDASVAALAVADQKATSMGLGNVTTKVMEFPLSGLDPDMGEFSLLTCLGVSFFHLATSSERLRTLRQFFELLCPGGILLLDNKNWNQSMAEERDPITLYSLPRNDEGQRLLALSYEYPRVGEQVYHAQLMRLDNADESKGQTYRTLKRWRLVGYPVLTSTIANEMEAAGFCDLQIVDEGAWPADEGDGKAAYYQLLIARKPE